MTTIAMNKLSWHGRGGCVLDSGGNCHSGALSRWFDTEWRWMADPQVAGAGAFGDLSVHLLDILPPLNLYLYLA